jgi:hypothetical protein
MTDLLKGKGRRTAVPFAWPVFMAGMAIGAVLQFGLPMILDQLF